MLGRAKSAMQSSKGRQLLDDDSGDELAGDSLLSHQAQQPIRSSLQSDAATSEHSKTKSNRTTAEDRNKPLPPIPLPVPHMIPSKEMRPALTSKSTNLKVLKKGLPARPKISKPVLQVSEDNDHNTALRAVNGLPGRESAHRLQTSVDDAEHLRYVFPESLCRAPL